MAWLLILLQLATAQPAREDYPGASAIYVLDSTKVIVKEDYSRQSYYHVTMRIFDRRGRDKHSNFMQRYGKKEEEIQLILANTHTIKENGDIIEVSKEEGIGDLSTVSSSTAPTYSDARIKTCAFGGVEPGDFVEYASNKLTKPPKKRALFGSVAFASDEPIMRKAFVLELPEKTGMRYRAVGEIEVDSIREGKTVTYRFSADSIPRIEHEQYMLPIAAFGPRVLYTTFGSWDEVGGWLREKFEPSIKTKGELAKRAEELGDIDKICQFVALGWQDIPIGFEDIGFAPTPTQDIYKNKYGSPLDKVALLVAMLRSIGEEAYPAWVAQVYVDKEIPAPFYFDDLVVAIPREGEYGFLDPVFPERRFFPLMVGHIILEEEPTYPLPFDRGSGTCFIVKKDTAFFYQMPTQPSNSVVEANLTLSADGTLSGKVRGVLKGIDAAYARRSLRGKREKELRQAFQGYAAQIGLGTRLISWEVSDLDSILSPVLMELEFATTEWLVEQADEYRFPLPPNIFGFAPVASYFGCEKREYPFTALSPHLTEFGMKVELPEGFVAKYVPEDFSLANSLVEAACTFACEEGVLTYNSVWGFRKGIYEPEDYKGLEEVHADLVTPKRGFIIFKRR